jgi:Zn-dependent protease/CBS domain-containing protein
MTSFTRPGARRDTPAQPRRRAAEIPLGRIAGVQIVADWSLAVIFVLVAAQLGLGILPSWHPGWSPALVWSVALIAAVAFFASIVVHELSHALVARLHGIPVRRITLFLFGGVAHLDREPSSPRAEFLTAVIGPVISFAIGFASIVLGWLAAGDSLRFLPNDPLRAFASMGPLPTLLLWLGPVNVMLAIFNLLPGFPLDGGRMLRAVLWWATRDLVKATRWAAAAGTGVGLTMIAFGVVSMIQGSFSSGIWLALIGWFLARAARDANRAMVMRHALDDVPLARMTRTDPITVTPSTTIDELVYDHMMKSDQGIFPVVWDGALRGTVSMNDLRDLPRADWGHTPVSDVMTPVTELTALPPTAKASDVLERFTQKDVEAVPIVEDGRVIGLVRRNDLLKLLAIKDPSIAG